MKYLIFISLGCIFYSCSFTLPEPDMHLRLKDQKSEINSEIVEGNVLTYSVASLDENQEIDCFYQVFQDESNLLIKAAETKMRDGIPSDTSYVYYFDKNQYIFAFEVKTAIKTDTLFNSVTAFYNKEKKIIGKEYSTVDNCDIPQENTDSIFVNFSYFQIPADVKTFVREKKILLRNR
ncbi:hypothetical protein GGR21_002788 [Dysgonomonas hofstadii]|uniref:Lipoprotein n=1 Tax=Dysgonomonas hofstadii TaxID=637886 RepID=A0A840CVN2_9BACT|nr:hypothetical protein [Dysgonomonas hofstadii]MBB4036875.1 hypothetical protein [Dysgonomonas hofstadii]